MRKHNLLNAISLTAVFVSALFLSGCAASMTYPEYAGAPKADPSLQPMPNLMADALKFSHQRTSPEQELVFNLPPTTPVQVWRGVGKRLDIGRPMTASDTMVWSVRQVRLSGGRAEVDVVYPTQGIYQIATVHFVGSTAQPFYPTMLQFWLVPVDAPTCNTPQAVLDQPKDQPKSAQ